MEKPLKYYVFFRIDMKVEHKATNNLETAIKWQGKYNGTVYEDTKYEARKRLYRIKNRIK